MRISVLGMGYVGTVSAACLADRGHTLIGVDTNEGKIRLLQAAKSPIVEAEVEKLLQEAHAANRLTATQDVRDAVRNSDMSIVCVGTPSLKNGSLNLEFVRKVCLELSQAIKEKGQWHDVVVRSTMLPGSTDSIVIPALQEFAGDVGDQFGLCINPEFLREGSAVYDFNNPPKTVIGCVTEKTAETVEKLFADLPGPILNVDYKVAECAKYVDNVWHALKVSFANEIGRVSRASDIDSREVMAIFKKDKKLNISENYLSPGFAFGGSCLPKDLRAFAYHARQHDVSAPVIEAILASNVEHIDHGMQLIHASGSKNIGVVGFAFKAGTDDLRESPIVDVIERLLGKGYKLKIFDNSVNIARLSGANRDHLMLRIPHITDLMVNSVEDVFANSETIVIGNNASEIESVPMSLWQGVNIVDLVGCLSDDVRMAAKSYAGPGWP
jgi:GDP-mannose 6-dehydrogenase